MELVKINEKAYVNPEKVTSVKIEERSFHVPPGREEKSFAGLSMYFRDCVCVYLQEIDGECYDNASLVYSSCVISDYDLLTTIEILRLPQGRNY